MCRKPIPRSPGLSVFFLLSAMMFFVAACGPPRARGPRPLDFTVTFRDAKGLEPGQFVVYNGVRIGEVRSVSLDTTGSVRVGVRVAPQHRHRLYREMEFTIEKPGGVVDVSGERQLTVREHPSAETRTPIYDGDIVQGTEGLRDRIIHRVKDFGSWLSGTAKKFQERLSRYQDSPEGRRVEEKLEETLRSAENVGHRGIRQLRDVELPELREKVEELAHRLERTGRSMDAQRLREEFRQLEHDLLQHEGEASEKAGGD